MSMNVPGIVSSSVSQLELLGENESLNDESLFLVETPQKKDEKKTPTGYVSRQGLYQQLTTTFVSDFRLQKLNADLQNMEMSLEVPSTYVEIENNPGVYSRRFTLSAISENNRASINDVSVYNTTEAMKDILSKITLPKLSAKVSPWIETSSITSSRENYRELVASQKLVTQISIEVDTGKYLPASRIKHTILENLTKNVASQKLMNGICATTETEMVKQSDVVNQLVTRDDVVASQALMRGLSATISSNFHRTEDLAKTDGGSHTIGAAQSLARGLSSNISSNFIRIADAKKYLTTEKVVSYLGNSTTMAASQKLMTDVSSSISSISSDILEKLPDPPQGETGDAYYLTPSNSGVAQQIANLDVAVCENNSDIDTTTQAGINFRIPLKIADISRNSVSSYNSSTNNWVKTSTLPIQETGIGRLCHNEFTGKTFFSCENSYVKIYQP